MATVTCGGGMDMAQGLALVVDDNRHIRTLCRTLLRHMGFAVEVCASGSEALQMLKAQSFDLLLVDVRLPDLDGGEILQRIRHWSATLAIIVITGHASVEDTARMTLLGAQGILLKPFTVDELRAVVDEVLRKRKDDRAAAQSAALHPLVGVSERLLSELDLPRLYDQIVMLAMEQLHADRALLLLRDEGGQPIRIVATTDPATVVPPDGHALLAGWVIQHCQPLRLDPQSELPPDLQPGIGQGRAVLAVPLVAHGRVLGVLLADKVVKASPFTAANQDLMILLAG